MKRNTTKLTALILALTLLFAGCGAKTESSPSPSTSAEATATERTVTDMLGRSVKIPAEVKSVATINSAARILTYAGCADKITGATDMDIKGAPGMPYTVVNKEHFSKLTPVGAGGAKDTQYTEAIVTLAPDLILSNYLDKAGADELQAKTNIPVVALTYDGVFSDGVYAALALVGDVMGVKEHTDEVTKAMKGWQKDLSDRTKSIADTEKPTVYAGAVSFKGGHGIEGTYAKYPPFDAIGAKNVVDETGQDGALLIEKEKLVAWDPDIIFLTPANMNLVNEDYAKTPDFYKNLKAVKNGRIYSQVSYNYNSTNIEIAIADAYYAGSVIYPDAFKDVDFEKKADEIFKTMLGTTYLQQLKDSGNSFGPITIGQ